MKDKYNNFKISFDSDEEIKNYYNQISENFNTIAYKDYLFIVNTIKLIHDKMEGRFGGNIEDLIIVGLTRYISTLEGKDGEANVEIGTLFGGTAILTGLIQKYLNKEENISNIMIDPLCGYYGNKIDFVSGLEVVPDRLIRNLSTFDVKNYEIIQELSTNESLIKQFNQKKIRSLFIDGDHSFAGILKDWNNFSQNIVVGGLVIIDNVNDKNWPNINIFIEKLKKKIINNWKIIYEGGISLVLQKETKEETKLDVLIDLEVVSKIESQLDKKFYERLLYRDQRIKELTRWHQAEKKENEKLRRWHQAEKKENEKLRRWHQAEKKRIKDIKKLVEDIEKVTLIKRFKKVRLLINYIKGLK